MMAKGWVERSRIEQEERQGAREKRRTMIELIGFFIILVASEILVQSRSFACKEMAYLATLVEARSRTQEQGTRFVK